MSARANTEAENAPHEAREAGGLGEKLSAVWERVADFVDEYKLQAATASASCVSASVAAAQMASNPIIAAGSGVLSIGLGFAGIFSSSGKDSVKKVVTALTVSFACFAGTGVLLQNDALTAMQAGSDREQARLAALPNQRSMTDKTNQTFGDLAECHIYGKDKPKYISVKKGEEEYAVRCVPPAQQAEAPAPAGQ
ncbi:MAG: hypothetical protein H6855_03750 [Rhodospirillales bacterium]|nr:hypothetical protein [Rhodospirillales bacterium]MCB9965177.1 hypothetical protein [Rhodospirillales bacterium]MCB9973196.1 hypothetical protein [Rhodospirillales bacterium]MCB9979544.1 hypothetical protein [Rhodospirillales bacterium]